MWCQHCRANARDVYSAAARAAARARAAAWPPPQPSLNFSSTSDEAITQQPAKKACVISRVLGCSR